MSFKNKNNSLIINGINYSKKELLGKKWGQNSILWQKTFYHFLSEWLNDYDFITVKTSGSTGKPKKIQLLKKRMVNSAVMTGNYFQLKKGDRALLCLPCEFIAGKMMVVRAMVLGLDLQWVAPSGNPMFGIDKPIDFAAMIPLQVANIFEQCPEKFKLITQLIIGGGKVDYQLHEKLQTISSSCFSTYGMTETVTHVAIKKLNGNRVYNYFEGLPSITFAKDNRGCLTITAPHLLDKPIVTNDIIDLKNASQFEWLGRFDNVINTGGVKVFPEKIEAKLEKLIFKRFFISSLPDKKLGNKVILIIEDQEWSQEKRNTLILDLKQVLSKFELPKDLYFSAVFEETPTKKIHRNRTKKKLTKFNL